MSDSAGRVVFFGSSDTGRQCCEALLDAGTNIVGVVTVPRQFQVSWAPGGLTNARFADLAAVAHARGVPVLEVPDGMRMRELAEPVREWRPDLLVVVGWYHLLPASLRAVARLGAVGVHASLLPRYRGGAPLVWAVINGETETGVTLFHLSDGVDDGDVVAQERIAIGESDNIGVVVERANHAAVRLIREFTPGILSGGAPRIQQDATAATVVPQRRPEDGTIHWARLSARAAYNWVRAQTRPYPGAFTYFGSDLVHIWQAELDPSDAGRSDEPAATLRVTGDSASVVCADRLSLALREISVNGGAAVSGDGLMAYLRSLPAGTQGRTAA